MLGEKMDKRYMIKWIKTGEDKLSKLAFNLEQEIEEIHYILNRMALMRQALMEEGDVK